jgi:ring-1,2-phenylacetyl-CoA epoxidase subunit PaaE
MDPDLTKRVFETLAPSTDMVEAFVCGPPGMMESVLGVLHASGLPDTRIHREYFTIDKHAELTTSNGMDATASAEISGAGTDAIIARTVRVRLYGDEHTFEVLPDETILTAAQRANLDPPYACQIGACCTCRAKIVSGRVVMDEREALSDDEIADGYALTCQSHPLTDDVLADYDQ